MLTPDLIDSSPSLFSLFKRLNSGSSLRGEIGFSGATAILSSTDREIEIKIVYLKI